MKRLPLPLVLPFLVVPTFAATETPLLRDWSFFRVDAGVVDPSGASKPDFDAGTWERVTLPHTVRIEAPETSYKPFIGIAWYRRTVTAKPEWAGKRVSLFFEGAMQVADVWVNGEKVMTHEGGYTPFVVDLTAALEKNGRAVVSLRLDNTHKPLIPPGKAQGKVDFCYFGGLYRDVTLRVSDKLHLTDAVAAGKVAGGGVFARYDHVSEKSADVLLSANVKNDGASSGAVRVRFTLKDASGAAVASGECDAGDLAPGKDADVSTTLKLVSPKLWTPETPYRYALLTEVLRDGVVADSSVTKLGVRSLDFNDNGFLLNGKRYGLRGANRHQDFPWLGNAVPDNAVYRDLLLLKEAGFNFLRLAHYPQSESVMEACDELGIMVSVCTPGWQYFNKDEVFLDHARQNIRDMVRWHRNHPCVAMWEVSLNETYGHDDFYAECARIAHEEYPGPGMLASGDTYASKTAGYLDIPYPVWVGGDKGNIANPTAKWKAAFIREYGDYNFGGQHSTSRVPYGAPEDALLLQAWNHQWMLNLNRAQPWFGGDSLWAGVDDASGFGNTSRPVSWWGPLSYMRLPKFSYAMYQSQRSPETAGVGTGPVTFIANYWTKRSGSSKVVVFSNCDEVELFLNGKSLGRRKPDAGPDSKYGEWRPDADPVYMSEGADIADDERKTAAQVAAHKAAEKGRKKERAMFDGGNARHLAHAPFTFPRIAFAPGELKAVGYRNGAAVSEFSRRTPGKPVALRVAPSEDGRPLAAGGSDAMFFRAYVTDAAGTTVPGDDVKVTFAVTGAGRAVSAATVPAENGVASALVTSGESAGTVHIVAEAPGLTAASFDYVTR